MAYRDDKEAAYARADALQRELDRAQAELERTKGKLADSERARDSLAKKLLTHNTPYVTPPPVHVPPPRRAGGAAIGSLFVIGAMSAFAINSGHHHYTPPPPDLSHIHVPEMTHLELRPTVNPLAPRPDSNFTIDSIPRGANVYAGDQLLGTTPLTMTTLEWSTSGSLAIDHDGYYRKVVEDAPWTATDNLAHQRTYTLDPRN